VPGPSQPQGACPPFHPLHPDSPPGRLTPAEFAVTFPGEDHHVEFKQGLSEHKLAEAITAFSNADGGVVLLGVHPSGRPVGIDASSELKARVHRVVARVHNPGRYSIDPLAVGEQTILVLSIDRRHDGFAQAPDGRVLARREAQNVVLVGAELQELLSRRALARFETQPTSTTLQRASPHRLRELADAWGWQDGDELPNRLVEKGLAVRDGRRVVLTIAGSLYLLDKPATDQRKYHVEVFRYRDESTRYNRRITVEGPLPDQVRLTTETLLDELGIDLVVVGTQRHDLPRVPVQALREAVANAVAHRTYEDTRRPVRVELRPGRVVVTSPGPLPEPVTVRNIRDQNAPRNIAVIDTLRRFGLAEDAGRGIDVMEDVMEAYLLAPPEFQDDGASVTVTLRTDSTVTPDERAWLLSLERDSSFTAEERQLLLLAVREGSVTNGRVRGALGINSVEVRRVLRRLLDRGILTRHGDRGGAQYHLSSGAPLGTRVYSPSELTATITELARTSDYLTNEQLRAATGLDRAIVLRALNEMVESGVLVRHGERRGVRYTLAQPRT
jgi:ATP-dependent DNA helicase RecG